MLPSRFSLQLYRGDSAAYQFLVWADRQGQTPLDLMGASVKAEIRDRPGGSLLATLITSVALPNIINMQVTAPQSRAMPPKAAWDLQMTFGTGEVLTPIAGGVAVTDDVTGSTDEVSDPGDFEPLPLPDPVPGPGPFGIEPPPPPPLVPQTPEPKVPIFLQP